MSFFFFFGEYMFIYAENLKESIDELLELREFKKIYLYKSVYKSLLHVYMPATLSKFYISFTIAQKKKYLGLNLTKVVQALWR